LLVRFAAARRFMRSFGLACVAYLLVQALQALRASRQLPRELSAAPTARPNRWEPSVSWGYRRALLTCVLNPKLGVFFVVFLPEFIPASASAGRTALALAALQAGEAVLWYLLLGKIAVHARKLLARRKVQAWLDRINALVFLGFGHASPPRRARNACCGPGSQSLRGSGD
jgi:threonine/homoserine/homoserine lactone efflux protein